MEAAMNKQPFHCHPSIILEKAGGFLVAWLLILLSQADEILPALIYGTFDAATLKTALFFLIFMLTLPVLIAGYQFLVWKKTWISLDENTLIIERNTLMHRKNTYSIPHIANINTEQNLFELVLHTCRVKIDLENATDAESTDISIILSCRKAQELKNLILSLRENSSCQTWTESSSKAGSSVPCASFPEILRHCICSLSGGFLIIIIVVLAVSIFLLFDGDIYLGELLWEDKNADFSMKVLAIGFIVISYGWQIVRKLLAFYHFTVFRLEHDLSIRYGFFRKQDYTIPVKNIQAVRVVQAPIARLLGLYEAQLVCIGIGDSSEELAQLTLCCKKSILYQQMSEILPEFSTVTMEHMHKPVRKTRIIYCASLIFQLICFCLLPGCLLACYAESIGPFLPGIFCAALFLILHQLLRFHCQGFYLGNTMALFSNGSLTKTIMFLPFQNIQHLCLKQDPLSRLFHLQRGSVYILASMLSREISFPYLEAEEVERLKKNMMPWKN